MENHSPNTSSSPNKYENIATKACINNRIKQHLCKILKHIKTNPESIDGGLYAGSPGIAFMFYYMAKNLKDMQTSFDTEKRQSALLMKAMIILKPAIAFTEVNKLSLLYGYPGVIMLAAAVSKELHDNDNSEKFARQYASLYEKYLLPNFSKNDLCEGRAGYLAGALWMHRALGRAVIPTEHMHYICDKIVESGRKCSDEYCTPCPLMYVYNDTKCIGAIRGLSSILQILITVPGYLEAKKGKADDIRATIDYILSLQRPNGTWPLTVKEFGLFEHVQIPPPWCEGSPGVVYLMARSYIVYKDPRFLESCVQAAERIWHYGSFAFGGGKTLRFGIVGNAYVFLLLYRLTKDEKYLLKAHAFNNYMQSCLFQMQARSPMYPFSLYDGAAGTVVFLTDLLAPNNSEFPFLDVFTN